MCFIEPGQSGECRVRINIDGVLRTVVYGYPCSINIDPIEKKPLFNFLPGSRAFSIGTIGCNFRCKHCQNFDISQYPHEHGGEIIGQDLVRSEKFTTSIQDGLDIRESLRHG